jgi:hypothetical protein
MATSGSEIEYMFPGFAAFNPGYESIKNRRDVR